MRRSLYSILVPGLLAGALSAQGSDSCGSAQVIVGTGLFPFSNVGATNDGPPLVNCGAPLNSDVWFAWTAPSTQTFFLRTCNQTGLDTVLAVYSGLGCPPALEVACNDDACSLQSNLTFAATSGSSYLIRVGSWSPVDQGSGNIDLQPVPSGGANDCANAQPIAGTGTFPWSNVGATTDGGALVNCTALPNSDIWFAWTAPTTDQYLVQTCNQTGLDTVMAAYAGTTCPATNEITCNDDACGLQTKLSFATTAGATYLIRLGSYSATAQDYGFMDILVDPCDGATLDDSLEPNDDCSVAVTMGDGTSPALWVSKADHDWYGIAVPDQSTLQVDLLFTHANGDVDTVLYDACSGNVLAFSNGIVDNELIVWANTTGAQVDTKLEVYVYDGSDSDCNVYDMVILGSGGGLGVKYCVANSNSTGAPADISASGSASSAAGNLTLESTPVPNQNGIFYHALNQVQIPFGNGFLCANGNIVRGAVTIAAGNIASYTYDNSDSKHSLGGFVGSTRNFQHWFRDPMGGGALFNLSNAISIAIQP